uniref:Uncharacterized protein n=1 Tax=Rhizophora mucronata TaxID=61149 RepID=A0A2P2NMM4_RHIMU
MGQSNGWMIAKRKIGQLVQYSDHNSTSINRVSICILPLCMVKLLASKPSNLTCQHPQG